MLTIAKEHILRNINPKAEINAHGQEINPQSFAIAKSDALIVGENADNIQFGNSFTEDKFIGRKFYYMLSNPPFGVSWKKEQEFIENEATNPNGRFFAGTPRVSDGALLFLQHMISKMEPKGSRIAIVFNGSPLFTGDAGSGESEIRKWIIENDKLEAIIGMPDQLFYNTGISTYVFIVTNKKSEKRKGKVQLINAVGFSEKMRKSLGNKRNYITEKQIEDITKIYVDFREGEHCKIFNNEYFGYTKVTIERPLKQSLELQQQYINFLAPDYPGGVREKVWWAINFDALEGENAESTYFVLKSLVGKKFSTSTQFVEAFEGSAIAHGFVKSCSAKQKDRIRAIYSKLLQGFGKANPDAEIVRDNNGNMLPDSQLRDTESIPLTERIEDYFKREVLPHVPDAWMDRGKDKVGYEISFTKYFYKYQPLRSLEDIAADILALEKDTEGLLKEIVQQ
jgi:type I restriction enzyme M protein